MTLILSERDVESLIDMRDVVASVEEAFRREGVGDAYNSTRTRSGGNASVLNVMHANLPYLGRGGLKAYMSSKEGTRFAILLFDTSDSSPLAIMGADILGRYRTGAASGVATKHMYGRPSGTVAIFGSGKQALTQALGLSSVMSVDEFRVWSPNSAHRDSFSRLLEEKGFRSAAFDSPEVALRGAQVACAITSSREPFLTDRMLTRVSHVNICGSNDPDRAEITPNALGTFDTVAVDDLAQAKVEYGDLIYAVRSGTFAWESAIELGQIVAAKRVAKGRTLFKSGGVALEDVAVASMLYDKAVMSGGRYPDVELR